MCGLARALEMVGDRWTLLIIRQLLTGPKRYVDLHNCLHGLSTNLLAERLKRLESDGILTKRDTPPPVATALYDLTDFGRAVQPAILELMRWGSVLLADPERRSEPIDPDWPLFPIRWLASRHPSPTPLRISLRIETEPLLFVEVHGSEGVLIRESPPSSDLVISSPGATLLGMVFGGHLELSEALDQGLEIEGDSRWLTDSLSLAYG
jgi:DNA-binding HxlR family transcriptional regulator